MKPRIHNKHRTLRAIPGRMLSKRDQSPTVDYGYKRTYSSPFGSRSQTGASPLPAAGEGEVLMPGLWTPERGGEISSYIMSGAGASRLDGA